MNDKNVQSISSFINFPPFYTLQPNLEVQTQQLKEWSTIVQNFCKDTSQYYVEATENTTQQAPYHNSTINRKLSLEALKALCQFLEKNGSAVLKSTSKTDVNSYLIFPSPIQDMAEALYSWATNTGKLNSVETLYNLQSSEDSKNQPFHGLPYEHLRVIIQHCQKLGRAQLLLNKNQQAVGVKFYDA